MDKVEVARFRTPIPLGTIGRIMVLMDNTYKNLSVSQVGDFMIFEIPKKTEEVRRRDV